MSTLFEQERHEPLIADAWDRERVDDAIDRIVARTQAVFAERGHWPSNSNDVAQAPQPTPSLYFGSAGLVWGLAQFGVRVSNDVALLREAANEALATLTAWNIGDAYLRGLLMGPSGIHLVAYQLSRDAEISDALYGIIHANIVNPVGDFMWGTSGTMLAAKVMFDATGEQRWQQVFADSAAQMFGELTTSPSTGVQIWIQHLYGLYRQPCRCGSWICRQPRSGHRRGHAVAACGFQTMARTGLHDDASDRNRRRRLGQLATKHR